MLGVLSRRNEDLVTAIKVMVRCSNNKVYSNILPGVTSGISRRDAKKRALRKQQMQTSGGINPCDKSHKKTIHLDGIVACMLKILSVQAK